MGIRDRYQMTQKGPNLTLVKKRRKEASIGLAMLESSWNQETHHYTQEDLADARNVIIGVLP